MGICLSAQIMIAEAPYTKGLDSKYVSADVTEQSSGSGKVSPSSVTPTPRSEILLASSLNNFTFADLKSATKNFCPDSVLGEPGFSSVFKGRIDEASMVAAKSGTGMVIAVKRLNRDGLQSHQEWLAEVNHRGQLYHPNLVKLVGYCVDDEHRLLVSEFMPRGSLENHIFIRGSYFQPLSWSLRMKVALGAARGLAFLHETKVMYRDFNTSNILLDSHYNAKLADFGPTKDAPTADKSHAIAIKTYGYEYLPAGNPTTRNNVYSYGVVLLEMISGRRAFDKNRPAREQNLVEWSTANKHKVSRVFDNRLAGQYTPESAHKAAHVALRCLSVEPKLRPSMNEVVKALEDLQEPLSNRNNGSRTRRTSSGERRNTKHLGTHRSI